tara:strand:+ start:3030 stop:3539 length:510 start_codon:yes stop_codon:yes gene_type:complete
MNEEYINSISLEYLLNPVLYEKITSQKNMSDNLIFKDIKFYRKRICQVTKEMCKGEYENNNLKSAFLNYSNTIIYYLKQLDEKDIFQSDYDGLNIINEHCEQLDISDTNIKCENADNLLINTPTPTNSLDNFVKKINIETEEKFLPKRRIANIKDPALKKKGVKKKILE